MKSILGLRKKAVVFAAAAVAAAVMCLCGCQNQEDVQPEEQVSYEIALVTDDGLINDGGHSEAAWNTITAFGATKGISHKYYKAVESTEAAYKSVIDTAVNNGAKIVIADGYDLGEVILEAQKEYTDIKFVVLDGEPIDERTGDIKLAMNSAAIEFDSAQAGFLAGYAAVVEGYGNIGFIGEKGGNDTSDFGFGFLRGADKAARESGENISVRYLEAAADHEAVKAEAMKWYDEGTDVIFACGKNIDSAVIEAAEAKEGRVIGGLFNRNDMSDVVITSAIQNVDVALTEVLEKYKKGEFPGGEVLTYDASNQGIELVMQNDRLEVLRTDEYKELLEEMAKGEIKMGLKNVETVDQINLRNVTLL
ncbi:MAG: BMP family ABC transporter substrate-binding protein [Firmicutes bacterium]|nr:BMP family ABC transporter substrate-binding protein [Bacillota bacterium]